MEEKDNDTERGCGEKIRGQLGQKGLGVRIMAKAGVSGMQKRNKALKKKGGGERERQSTDYMKYLRKKRIKKVYIGGGQGEG